MEELKQSLDQIKKDLLLIKTDLIVIKFDLEQLNKKFNTPTAQNSHYDPLDYPETFSNPNVDSF